MSERDDNRPGSRRDTERLLRRIRETRSVTGHALRCSSCDRLSTGHATGWTMRLADSDRHYILCPECEEFEFGGTSS
jgi:hypothetical protein